MVFAPCFRNLPGNFDGFSISIYLFVAEYKIIQICDEIKTSLTLSLFVLISKLNYNESFDLK